ncbi:hypothetical protein BCR36DRAFT_581641 [Piromyces finnis]|uniref:Uncharacterized protein n=1 Tax=Piromyces finnis TaxID=1754191 RepID=A0A1Y1VGC3_9FUNG|nr:hypothetical protein BCR36DRAFT_581641 [Piromyces finnis]|eukprot:ORX54751.1 hypothetical protein BCR36DRAFT_581641 [Piromyces finnis]
MDPRGVYSNYNASNNIRERGDRRNDRERRGPRDRSPNGRRIPNSPGSYRRDDPRSENYRGNRRDMDNSQMQQVHIKENSYNKQYNNNSSSLNNSSSNLIQSPFQNPYKIDSNSNKTTNINDPSKDRLETYAKLKKISPVKFYISVIIAVILTATLAIIGIIVIKNNGLTASNLRDVTVGVAQGYLFYCGFMLLAIGTGVLAFIRKWNNLLVTYCSFLFVSCLYICYFISDLANVKTNCVEVMNTRWKEDFNSSVKASIENQFSCCGYYNEDDDPVETDDCQKSQSFKRSIIGGYDDTTPYYYNASLHKRKVAEENGCAKAIESHVSSHMTMYIIIFSILLILNIVAVVVTILDIKQYAEILKELSNPFA